VTAKTSFEVDRKQTSIANPVMVETSYSYKFGKLPSLLCEEFDDARVDQLMQANAFPGSTTARGPRTRSRDT
jgi:hypothetical protein